MHEQIAYRSVTQAFVDSSGSLGKLLTHLGTARITKNVYETAGRLVEVDTQKIGKSTIDPLDHTQAPEPIRPRVSTLISHTNHLKIAEVQGALFEDQEADFMSFEPYEISRLNSQPENHHNTPVWTLTNVSITQGPTLTGSHYAQIKPNGTLAVSYTPSSIEKAYSVGAWVRSTENPVKTALLSVSFESHEMSLIKNGTVQKKFGNWMYVEAILDMTTFATSIPKSGTLNIRLSVKAEAVDVDTLMFSPLASPLKARVFQLPERQPIATLDNSGQIQRIFYNSEGQTVATTFSDTCIQGLYSAWSPQSSAALPVCISNPQYGSQVIVRPENGFWESADPASITTRWELTVDDWTFDLACLTKTTSAATSLSVKGDLLKPQQDATCYVELLNCDTSTILTVNLNGYSSTLTPSNWLKTGSSHIPILVVQIGRRIFIWAHGQLVMDNLVSHTQADPSATACVLTISGPVTLKNLMVGNHPSVSIRYQNNRAKVTQSVQILSDTSAQISLQSYDSLNRNTSSSLPIVVGVDSLQHLAAYRDDSHLPSVAKRVLSYQASPLANISEIRHEGSEYQDHPSLLIRGTFSDLKMALPDTVYAQLSAVLADPYKENEHRYIITQDANGYFSVIVQNQKNTTGTHSQSDRYWVYPKSIYLYQTRKTTDPSPTQTICL
jgi:YD repeat-containing protein